MFLQFLVDVEHLAYGSIKTGEKLAAYDQDIDLSIAKPALHGFFITVGITVPIHHLVPIRDDDIVSALIHIVDAFAHIRRGDDDGASQIAELFKALQITDCVPLAVCRKHCLESRTLEALHKVFANIQCYAFDTRIGRCQTANAAPLLAEILLLRIRQPLCGLLEPQVYILFVHMLIDKTPLIDQRDDCAIFHAILDGVLVDQFAEPGQSVLFALHQRRSGEPYVTGIWENAPHLGRHESIV